MEFKEAVGKRRSIRHYSDRPVEMEKIQIILGAQDSLHLPQI